MDPLSITAGIIAVVGVGTQAAKAVRKLASMRGASDLVLALNNEISDLNLVVLAIQDVYQQQHISGVPSLDLRTEEPVVDASVINSLMQANDKVLELKALHQRLITTSTGSKGSTMLNKAAWLQEQQKVRKMQEDLRSVRLKLDAALGLLNSSALVRLEKRLVDIQNKMGDLYGTQQNHARAQERSLRKQEAAVARSVTRLLSNQQRMELKFDIIEATSIGKVAAEASTYTPVTPRGTRESNGTPSAIHVTAAFLPWRCVENCVCACHHRKSGRTPCFLDRFFGALFISYFGLPFLTPQCDSSLCEQRSNPTASAMYYFPKWFLARVFFLILRMSLSDGLEIRLRMPRLVDQNSLVFQMAQKGDVNGLKATFQHRLGSPNDISSYNSWTLLHFACENMQPEACKFLLQAGADPSIENSSLQKPSDSAWNMILSNRYDTRTVESMRALFKGEDFLEKCNFTLLQKAVLGLNPLNLDALLKSIAKSSIAKSSIAKSAIDEFDGYGRTALFWAALRGDAPAISVLLEHGADINKKTQHLSYPLKAAVFSRNLASIRVLLDNNVDLNSKDSRGWTSMHHYAYFGIDVETIKLSHALGADIEALTNLRSTPLMVAVQDDQVQVIKYLISQVVDIDRVDVDGECALHRAIKRNSHESLRLLIQHGADHSTKTNLGENLLHYAAQYGDFDCLKILHAADLDGIDISDRAKSLTALEMAERRKTATVEWLERFRKLVHGKMFPKSRAQPATPLAECETFMDAPEFQI